MIRRLYDWVMDLSDSRYATTALFLIAFAESSFFPIPPDVLLMALAISAPRRAFLYALVCTGGSVLGGLAGYAIGYYAFDYAGKPIIEFYGVTGKFDLVGQKYQENAFAAITIAGFTPIPYKVFTIAAGVFKIGLPTLVGASVVGRAGRFFLVAGLIRLFGPNIKALIDKYFNILSIAFVVLLVLGFLVIRLVSH